MKSTRFAQNSAQGVSSQLAMQGADLNWTAADIRKLRYRMGWTQSDFARRMNLELKTISHWEAGQEAPADAQCHQLVFILQQVESHSDKVQRRPIAETLMRDRGLSQIHDLDVDEASAQATDCKN